MAAFVDQLYSPEFPLAHCQLYCHDSTRRWLCISQLKLQNGWLLGSQELRGVHCCTKHGLLLPSERYRKHKMLPVALFALVGFTTLVYSRAKLHLLTTLHQFAHLASAVRDYSAGRAGSKVGVCLGLTPVLGSPLHLPPLQFLPLTLYKGTSQLS